MYVKNLKFHKYLSDCFTENTVFSFAVVEAVFTLRKRCFYMHTSTQEPSNFQTNLLHTYDLFAVNRRCASMFVYLRSAADLQREFTANPDKLLIDPAC